MFNQEFSLEGSFLFNLFNVEGEDLSHDLISTILDKEAKKIEVEEILKKICVSSPYFAFKKIYQYKNFLIAPIKVEQPINNELNSIPIAEAGRHIAILGSVADAINEDSKHYYLATKALMSLHNISKHNDLYVVIESHNSDKKNMNAFGYILDENGSKLYDLKVLYQKLPEKVFCKIFNKYFIQTNEDSETNPYENIKIVSNDLIIKNDLLTTEVENFLAEDFAGHFKNYPMLPVSISAYIMTYYAGKLFNKINNKENFLVKTLDLEVLKPASPNQKLKIEISLIDDIYRCNLTDSVLNSDIARMDLRIT